MACEQFYPSPSRGFAKHGPAVIEKVRTDKPDVYLKVIAGLLPKDVNLNVRPLDELTDEQLMARLAQSTEMAKPLLAKPEGDHDEVEPKLPGIDGKAALPVVGDTCEKAQNSRGACLGGLL